jgi:hypothetical protein
MSCSKLLLHQAGMLRSYFPQSKITRHGEKELVWIGELTPSPLSNTYKVKVHYKPGEFIRVFVIEPKLRLADGATSLPHVYSTQRQQLCLYYPKDKEWTPSMWIADSIIPWASEWLYHYEIWVGTGDWRGGGIEHDNLEDNK